jgi:hypothetical protein
VIIPLDADDDDFEVVLAVVEPRLEPPVVFEHAASEATDTHAASNASAERN